MAPATWGAAIEVPVKLLYPPGTQERTLEPGAATSGLIRREPEPPQAEGPRLEEFAIGSVATLPFTFATQNTFTRSVLMFLGAVMVDGSGPSFPAENTTATPTASTASRVSLYILFVPHWSTVPGSYHEQFTTSTMSMVVAGLPSGSAAHSNAPILSSLPPPQMVWEPVHRALKATPIVSWLSRSMPTIVPMVWVPCSSQSEGVPGVAEPCVYQLHSAGA